jgi:hypothetical protein
LLRKWKRILFAAREEDYSHYTLELIAPNGRLRYEYGGERIIWQNAVRDPHYDGYITLSQDEEYILSDILRSQWNVAKQLALSINGQECNICTGADGLKTLELLESIRTML